MAAEAWQGEAAPPLCITERSHQRQAARSGRNRRTALPQQFPPEAVSSRMENTEALAARTSAAVEPLVPHLRERRIVVLSAPGMRAESGIPEHGGAGADSRRAPVQYQEFVRSDSARARSWSRSTSGWPRMRNAPPIAGRRALAQME